MKPIAAAGYSGLSLAKKLGITSHMRVVAKGAPANYAQLVDPLPHSVTFEAKPSKETDLVHVFVDRKATLAKVLRELRTKLRSDAVVWVSWPKRSSKVETDFSEDTIREVALPLGFVDVKVCAVSDIWSGLKVVVRRELR